MADRLPSRPPRTNWGNLSKNLALWLLVGLLALALFQMMSRQRNPTQEFSYTEFSRQLDRVAIDANSHMLLQGTGTPSGASSRSVSPEVSFSRCRGRRAGRGGTAAASWMSLR